MANQVPTDAEAVRLELQEAVASFRQAATLSVQIAGFLAAADSLLLAYGFAQHQSGIFLVASLMPILLVIVGIEILKYIVPIGYVAMVLERELGLRIAPLATVFLWRVFRGSLPSDISSVDLADQDFQNSLFSSPTRLMLTRRGTYIMYAVSAVQVGLCLIATFAFNFRFM